MFDRIRQVIEVLWYNWFVRDKEIIHFTVDKEEKIEKAPQEGLTTESESDSISRHE